MDRKISVSEATIGFLIITHAWQYLLNGEYKVSPVNGRFEGMEILDGASDALLDEFGAELDPIITLAFTSRHQFVMA